MYLSGNEGAPPREQLVRAMAHAPKAAGGTRLRALDVGCGPGREALFLAQQGFEVVALDPYPEMLQHARELFARSPVDTGLARFVRLEHATLEDFAQTLEPSSFDLVHAGFVLPFVLPAQFDACFARLAACLRSGGLFCGQFFGRDDEFIRSAEPGTMSCQSRDEIERLLEAFDIHEIDEVNRTGRIGKGREKWWHVFHVTAERR
ncbi:MAG: hypothetical protein RLY21_678 [Planctomycetota bacterium]|jgi:SAM-dependent methyltransferase